MLNPLETTARGRLVADPELRFTGEGVAVLSFRLACQKRYRDRTTNEWKDGQVTFLTVNIWRQPAESIAGYVDHNNQPQLRKGRQVIVNGELASREYTDREGVNRTVYEMTATDVMFSAFEDARYAEYLAKQSGQAAPAQPAPQAAPAAAPEQTPVPAAAGYAQPGF